jgi:hypothetical protein
MEKRGITYLTTLLMFVITIITLTISMVQGKLSGIFTRIGKGLMLIGQLSAIGRNWGILREELDDLSIQEEEELAQRAVIELEIKDTETALHITRKSIKLVRELVDFVQELSKIGKIEALASMVALLLCLNLTPTYAQASIDSARVNVFTATKTNAVYVNQTFASQVTGIFFQAPDATLYMTRAGVEYRILKTRVQGRGEQGNVDDFFKNQFILRAKDTVRFRTDGGNALIYFLLRRTTSTGQ